MQRVDRAAVLGAGTMGAQIAGLLASYGVPCDLLDLPSEEGASRLAEEAKERLLRLRPAALRAPEAVDLIRPGSLSDDLGRLRESDWVIEAVVEKREVKRQLWAKVAPHLRPEALASTNTSGIPIGQIATALPEEVRGRFLGVHFFNPPRHLRLLEVIPGPETATEAVAAIREIGEGLLDKGVVVARDVPGFIGNRVGCYGLLVTLRAAEEFSLGPDEVDAITGPAMGRPSSATFRTLDLVGLDVFVDICDFMGRYLKEPREQVAFEAPGYMREMLSRGWAGEKSGQGFYKRVEVEGGRQILALDRDTFEYRPRRGGEAPSLAAVQGMQDPGQRLRTLVSAEDLGGRFAWRVLSQLLVYAAEKVGEVADDIVSIDRAMRWGFNWEQGPFEAWDSLGVGETVSRMRADGLEVPGWVTKQAEEGRPFYRHDSDRTLQATPDSGYVVVGEARETAEGM